MAPQPRRWLRVTYALLIAIVVAAALLAPVGGTGTCVDSPDAQASSCDVAMHSIVGIPTNPPVWIIGTAAFCAMALAFARTEPFSRPSRPRRPRRRR